MTTTKPNSDISLTKETSYLALAGELRGAYGEDFWENWQRYNGTAQHGSSHTPSISWDEITNPNINFNGATVDVWQWINDFIPKFVMEVITYPRWDQN